MKANFALKLSFAGIRLLHRAAGGWRIVGEVALDDPDLDGALAALRKTALGLEPSGLRTKLVLPDTQIRYLTIDTADMDADQLHKAAEAALDGATPYAVSDLVFDLSPDGDQTHIAAVARETMAEAESFAAEHRFAPISLVAIPEDDPFLGEPFFGPTEHAAEMLDPGEEVEPDGIAVVELGPREWPEGPVVDVAEEAPVAGQDPAPAAAPPDLKPPVPEPDAGEPAPGPAQQETGPVKPDRLGLAVEAGKAAAAQAESSQDETADPVVGFASRRQPGATGAPQLGGVTRRFDPAAVKPAPTDAVPTPLSVRAEKPEPSLLAGLHAPRPPEQEAAKDDVPDPPPAALGAFLSRRPARNGTGHPPQTVAPDAPGPSDTPARTAGRSKPVNPPPTTYVADRAQPEIRPVRVPRPQSEQQRMTVFGARQPDSEAAVGGKPRFLGLILTAFLLIFLAGVAAWATVFVDDGLARFFGNRAPEAPATAEEQAPQPEPEAPGTEPGTDDVETAALDAELPPEAAALEPEVLAEPAEPRAFDPAEAEAQYAETGIWAVPPAVPDAPGLVGIDDLYVTSIDPANLSFDAVALNQEPPTRTDRAPLAPANPAPPGTEFDLDERDLVIPTPDGAMSPDGILIHSGQPPVVPPDTPDRAEILPDAPDAAARQELSRFRPRLRPDDLVENTERQRLGGLTRTELAGYRPRVRPETVKQAAEEDETPTEQAVASALRPTTRPGNFQVIVTRAREAAATPPPASNETGTAQASVASTAPRTVAPAIPSRSSVAREATVRNAINLRRINLMGVYGSSSNRRALVRLSNGRYKKVKVGDRIDGGRVSAIGDSELSYTKGNRNIVLTMPRT